MDLSELRLQELDGREQNEHPYLKRVCCMLWTESPVQGVLVSVPFQPKDLEQLSIVERITTTLGTTGLHRNARTATDTTTDNVPRSGENDP
ncbi:hypothetical protein TNCV_3344141 [Trichonephila clavipes]|nr:hypothetical protein TNCV_3344141 [Trichonephila clavipes]